LHAGTEKGPEHRLGWGTVLPEVLDGFFGNIEPSHPGAAAQQVAGHLTTPAHGIEHPLPPQVDPRHHRLVEEPQTIRHAERVGIVTLVFLRQAILMPTLFLLRRMLVSRPLVANTFVRLERVPVVQLRPSMVTTVNPMRSPRAHRPNTACGSKRKGRTLCFAGPKTTRTPQPAAPGRILQPELQGMRQARASKGGHLTLDDRVGRDTST